MKDELKENIFGFMEKIKGKTILTFDERKEMFGLYNRWYNAAETNYDCEICWIRVHTKLNNIK